MDIQDWSATAASNTDIDGIDISEGCDPANINNAIRAVMANIAGFRDLFGGAKVSAGSADAQTLTTGLALTAYGQGLLIAFEAGAGLTNTGAMTMNVDAIGAKSLKLVGGANPAAGAVTAGGIYLIAYEAGADALLLLNPTPDSGLANIVEDTTPQLGGDLDLNGHALDFPSTANISDVLDEDTMASNSATALATQQSIKAYADTKVASSGIGTVVQAHGDGLDDIAGLTPTNGYFVVGDGSNWTAESGSTARTSIGLGTTDSPQFAAIDLGDVSDTTITRASAGTIAVEGSNVLLASGLGSITQAYDVDTLKADTADVLTAGFATTAYNAGTKSSGTFTLDESNGNHQYVVNGGAHTLAPPSNNCSIVLHYTNSGSAGTITTSGFTAVDGDSFSAGNGDEFICYVTKINDVSHLTIKALQ